MFSLQFIAEVSNRLIELEEKSRSIRGLRTLLEKELDIAVSDLEFVTTLTVEKGNFLFVCASEDEKKRLNELESTRKSLEDRLVPLLAQADVIDAVKVRTINLHC